MSDFSKKVKNPLLNNAVTGGTVEDFSQNALLLPAKEKTPPPPPPVLHLSPQRPPPIEELNLLETISTSVDSFQNQQPSERHQQIVYESQDFNNLPVQQNHSNLTSVFSSFSNILKLNGNSHPPVSTAATFALPVPGIEAILTQPLVDAPPVPLYPASGIITSNLPASGTPPQRPVNTYRRPGLKRPVYAQVPGLSSQQFSNFTQPSHPELPFFQPPQPTSPQSASDFSQPLQSASHFSQPPPVASDFSRPLQPQKGPGFSQQSLLPHCAELQPPQTLLEVTPVSPSLSSVSSTQELIPASCFKPISPQPSGATSSATAAEVFIPVQQNFLTSLPFTPSNLQSPVMAAIPANELLQPGHVGSVTSTNVNGEPVPMTNTNSQTYRPVYHHWFHKREVESKVIWQPMSMVDSLALEQAFTSNDLDPDRVVATDGGRYDVNILRRERIPVYWKGTPNEVRRCSWFHKSNSDGRYVPYEENIATKLEEEFKAAFEAKQWNRKVELPNGESVVFHAADVLVLFPPTQTPDAWGNTPNQSRPRVVKRGMDEFDIDEGEPAKVDHLLFMVHGIGSVCDLKFRTVEEVVDEFRRTSLQLIQSHYKSSCDKGLVNRVEVLPISWHQELHSEDTGIDKKLKSITLESIPKLRDFTNDTLLDILFYTSPIYCQTIIFTVGNQLNKVYELFRQRNPDFTGGVSLGGHSLGSLILFDLLCHQYPQTEEASVSEDEDSIVPMNDTRTKPPPLQRRMSRRISYMMGAVGTGQPQIHYPHLNFEPRAFFALGSPIGMFVTVRGLDTLGEEFALPTCPAFFNIFHPYDPVAYRVESLINAELANLKPVLIPHHKGRKRMHLELKETMARVGADLKQRVIDSMKSTWNSFYQLAMFHRQNPALLEEEVDKALQEQLRKREEAGIEEPEQQQTDLSLGLLNNNRRIDYVLQEAPFEFVNDYIFALTSHVCYWDSEDTMLLILKEIYSNMNISTDDKIPQQTMTIERPPPPPEPISAFENLSKTSVLGMNPAAPVNLRTNLEPPPMSGFVKKT